MLRRAWIVPLVLAMAACHGSRAPAEGEGTARPPHHKMAPVVPQPLEVKATATRKGGSLQVQIDGLARGHGQDETFEDPTTWEVSAAAAGQPLKKVANGPVHVERLPVGDATADSWDVSVSFSTYFELPAAADRVELHVAPPPPAKDVTMSVDVE